MFTTLITNIVIFVILLTIFEKYRFYKQIYLKRQQPRFTENERVPPIPPAYPFGWLVELMRLNENDVLNMVGLDAYMLLRFHVVCYKIAIFFSFWGLLVLVPLYSTVDAEQLWDKYTLSNVMAGEDKYKFRLWGAAIFGYIFAAYFCQLLYAEYSNFSLRRLQYLVQADPDSSTVDPDTPPQKYFTVMIERIPGSLRSADAIYKFFDKLFPGEVFHVEVALDLHELDALNSLRKQLRYKLEKAIASYEATDERPQLYLQTSTPTLFPDQTTGMAVENDEFQAWVAKLVAPEEYGYELTDSINYYVNRLIELNTKVKELQEFYMHHARNTDKKLQERMRKKHDTRVAAAVENAWERMAASASSSEAAKKVEKVKKQPKSTVSTLENLFFGPPVQDYRSLAREEMMRVEASVEKATAESVRRRSSGKAFATTAAAAAAVGRRQNQSSDTESHPTLHTSPATPLALTHSHAMEKLFGKVDEGEDESGYSLSGDIDESFVLTPMATEQRRLMSVIHKASTATSEEKNEDGYEYVSSDINYSMSKGGDSSISLGSMDSQGSEGVDSPGPLALESNRVFRQWAKDAKVDLTAEKQEQERRHTLSRKSVSILEDRAYEEGGLTIADTIQSKTVHFGDDVELGQEDSHYANAITNPLHNAGDGDGDAGADTREKEGAGAGGGGSSYMSGYGLSAETISTTSRVASNASKLGWEQTKVAGSGALKGLLELSRVVESVTLVITFVFLFCIYLFCIIIIFLVNSSYNIIFPPFFINIIFTLHRELTQSILPQHSLRLNRASQRA